MDAATLAPQIRKAVRLATKDPGDALYGLTVSVKQMTGSMVTGVDVIVRDLDEAELIVPEDDREPGHGWATPRAQAISNRLHELAAPAIAKADGRHSFCSISFDGLMAPAPRDDTRPHADDPCGQCGGPRNSNRHLGYADGHDFVEPDPAADAAEVPAEPVVDHIPAPAPGARPDCPNGHGPMPGRADIRANGEDFGAWHTCIVFGCHASYIAPSPALVRALASGTGVEVAPSAPAFPPAELGARRGGLAAVR